MRIEEATDALLARVRTIKEAGVARAGGKRDDLHPIIDVWRGNDLVVELTLLHHRREEILLVAQFAAAGYDADTIAIVFEGYQGVGTFIRSPGINPMTNRPWQAGELSEAAEKFGALEKGWVRESLNVSLVNRAGDSAHGFQAYDYLDGKVRWFKPTMASSLSGNITPDGSMLDALLHGMQHPSAGQMAPRLGEDLDQDQRDLQATLFVEGKQEMFSMLLARADEEQRIKTFEAAGARYTVLSAS